MIEYAEIPTPKMNSNGVKILKFSCRYLAHLLKQQKLRYFIDET